MTSSKWRRVLAFVTLAGVAALAAACSSSGGGSGVLGNANPPAPSASVTAGSPGTPTTSATATVTATVTTHPTAPAGVAKCPTKYLQAKIGASQGAAGSSYVSLDFTNISSTTCTLYGYPGVSFAGGSPVKQIGLAATESTAGPRVLVTLKAGAVANALLQIVNSGNVDASSCDQVTASYLQIYPPNQTTPTYLAFSSPTCSKPVQILTVGVMHLGVGTGE